MLKILIKNEFLKIFRQGGKRSGRKAATYLLIMGAIGVLFMLMSFLIFFGMAPVLTGLGIGWLCLTYAAIFAIAFAAVGSVFMAQSQLYRAKDNDLLLSLPVPPRYILFCRMLPIYVQNFYFCFVILFPAYIAYAIYGGISFLSALFFIIALAVIPLFCTTLCCLLGFVVALIVSRLKHANIFSVVISLLFFAAYFVVCFFFTQIINGLTDNGAQIADGIIRAVYPLYLVGRMMEGDPVGFAVIFAICTVAFALLYLLLSKTYYGIITRNRSAAGSVYREKKLKRTSVWGSLIGKEAKMFFRSTAYLLNCGLGVVILLVATVFAAVVGGRLTETVGQSASVLTGLLPVLFCAVICLISGMDCITAPSVSLEGKSVYLLQSLPVEGYKPLFAKVFFHVAFNAPMAVIAGITTAIVFKASAAASVMLVLMPVATNFLFGALGLIFNLKKPVLDWENETTVIKQSTSVMLTMLSLFGTVVVLTALYFAASLIMGADVYLIVCFVLISAGAAMCMLWLKKRGAKIFGEL